MCSVNMWETRLNARTVIVYLTLLPFPQSVREFTAQCCLEISPPSEHRSFPPFMRQISDTCVRMQDCLFLLFSKRKLSEMQGALLPATKSSKNYIVQCMNCVSKQQWARNVWGEPSCWLSAVSARNEMSSLSSLPKKMETSLQECCIATKCFARLFYAAFRMYRRGESNCRCLLLQVVLNGVASENELSTQADARWQRTFWKHSKTLVPLKIFKKKKKRLEPAVKIFPRIMMSREQSRSVC